MSRLLLHIHFRDILGTNTSLTPFAFHVRLILPRCDLCEMQVNATSEKAMTRHQGTGECVKGHKRNLQRKVHRHSTLSLNEKFTAYRQKLERVEVFKYLGRLLTYDSNNIQDVRSNPKKARIFLV